MYKPYKLPYAYADLEPYIDAETMNIHYNKHYMGYLNNLNEEINKTVSSKMPIERLIMNIDLFSDSIRNNAGGYYNHSLFWQMLKPASKSGYNIPQGKVKELIERDFGTTLFFRDKIEKEAKKRFGSGWVWWIMFPNGSTAIVNTPYQDNPKMYFDCEILLGIDVWEHAYYLKYKNDRNKYVDEIFNVINWDYPLAVIQKHNL